MQHIFIAEIDGKEIDMAAMMPEEKQKAIMEMTRKFVEHLGYQQEKPRKRYQLDKQRRDKRCFTISQRHSA